MTDPEMPEARVEPRPRRSVAWLLPVVAVALAVFLLVETVGTHGTLVTVRADEGHGIQAGDVLRYRGIEVGRIEEVRLSGDLSDVGLRVRLEPGAEDLARAGSRFWIVRPRLTLDRVQGLETVVGARHLAIDPGPPGARRQTEFVALPQAPVVERREAGGLELFLEAPSRLGLREGAPVTYRRLPIGRVLSVGLSSDATSVEFRVWIRPEYVQLVREESVFWETGGVELGLSLTEGLRLDVGTLHSLLIGGVALATPEDAGELVSTGHRFVLHPEGKEKWLEWSPPLAVGGRLLPADARPPRLLRAAQRWRQGRILTSERSRAGWVLPIPGGIVGPAELLVAEEGAHEGSATLEVAGERIPLEDAPSWTARGLARRSVELAEVTPFALEDARPLPHGPREALVFGDAGAPPLALGASRLQASARGWEVDDAVVLDESWNGAAVVLRESGALVGVLVVRKKGAHVAPLPVEGR